MEIHVGDVIIHSLLYADAYVVLAQDWEDIQYKMRKFIRSSEVGGMKLNITKSEYLMMGDEGEDLQLESGIINKSM